MKKGSKVIRNVIIVLAVLVVSIIAFVGIYVEENGVLKNLIPSFTYGMEIDGTRELRYLLDTSSEEKEVYVDENGNIMGVALDTEESTEVTDDTSISLDTTVESTENTVATETVESSTTYTKETRVVYTNPEVKTLEDFENTKKIIQDRLAEEKEIEYNIRLDTLSNNELIIEVPNNEDYVTYVRSMIENIGKFEMVDAETGIVVMDNSHIKSASAGIGNAYDDNGNQVTGSSQVYLTLNLTKEGRAKLKEISNTYTVSSDEAGNDTSKVVNLQIDGTTLLATAFEEEYDNNILQFHIGDYTDNTEDLLAIYETVSIYARTVDTGRLPLVYNLSSDNYIQSSITSDVVNICMAIFAVLVLIFSVVLVVKFKANGALGAVLNVGYIALLVLVARYADIVITLNSSLAFVAGAILNSVFMYIFLNKIKDGIVSKEAFKDTLKKVYLAIVPICIIAIIFTCLGNAVVGSIGTVLFWGILIQIVYGFVVVKNSYTNN